MKDFPSLTFRIRNIDCPSCAVRIERGLKTSDFVRSAVVDFANLTLTVDAPDSECVIEAVKKIDPSVVLVLKKHATLWTDEDVSVKGFLFSRKSELIHLCIAAFLFLAVLFFEEWFHAHRIMRMELAIIVSVYLLAGRTILLSAFRTIRRGRIFDENVLMMIATAGAIFIHAYSEALGVVLFYKVGELLQEMAVTRSRQSIQSLLSMRPDQAYLKTGQGYERVSPEDVKVGDEILVKPGEKIPLDGVIRDGQSIVDTSAITGEFKPQLVHPGDAVLAGMTNSSGILVIEVTQLFTQSSIAKVLELVEHATERKTRTEKFITSFAYYYTPAVVIGALAVALIPPFFMDASFEIWFYRALVLMVISCPCALMVSIPLGYFGGIGRASRRGILLKGSHVLDALAHLKTVVFDKTGTLTRGIFKVKEVAALNGKSRAELLEFAAAAEFHSPHPIGNAIRKAYALEGGTIDPSHVTFHEEIPGEGVCTTYRGKIIRVGSNRMLHRENISHRLCDFNATTTHIAVDGEYFGYILIDDEIKEDSMSAVKELREKGVDRILMFTGDHWASARSVSEKLGLDGFHAGLLPHEKLSLLEDLKKEMGQKGKIAFVGDGTNDAPVIAGADIGIAMGRIGSDVAIETADMVLMTDFPSRLPEALSIARKTRRIVWQNIGLVFFIKSLFMILGTAGAASMWEAVFADMGTALLAVFNSMRILRK